MVDDPISKSLAADEKSECTRGVCAKRSRCPEVDCDGAPARCCVTLISEVDSCGLLVGVEDGSELLGSYEIGDKQLAAAARADRLALLRQKRLRRQNHVGADARNRAVVADLDFNKLGQQKCDSRRTKPYTNRRKPLLVECHVSDGSNFLDFEEACVGMLFDIHGYSWCPLTTLSMFYGI